MAVPRRGHEEAVVDPVPFGRYVLLDRIAEGRIGTVHRACLRRAGRPDKLLAIKRVSLELSCDPGFAEHFNAVMSQAAALEHPALCAIEDVGRAPEGSLYAAMDLVAGKDLGRVAAALHERCEVMPAALVAYVGSRIAGALAAAHAMRRAGEPVPLYHGELAPTDILIGYDGAVCLTGLGSVALQAVSPDPAPRYAYRAPEVERGICSAQSDVYSLGACMYELLSGGTALRSGAHGSAVAGGRRPESHITRVIPRPLDQIVGRALAQDPAARWQSTAELALALQQWCSTQSERADGDALAAFMRAVFDAAQKADAMRLQACLARIAGPRPAARTAPALQPAPELRPNYPQLVRAHESNRSSAPARASTAPSNQGKAPASGPVPRNAKPESWTDPSEQTPARGMLMQKLAADMVVPAPSPPRTPEIIVDNLWDDDSPADRWISEGEERDASAWRMQPRKAAAPPREPVPLVAPAASAVAVERSPMHSASARPAWLVPAGAGAGLLLVIAAVALFRNAGSATHEGEPRIEPAAAKVPVAAARLGTAPTHEDGVQNSAAPAPAPAPPSEGDRQAQLARAAQVLPKGAPQTARALDDGASDRSSARHRRAASERDAVAGESSAFEAMEEPSAERALPAVAVSEPAARQEPAPVPAEQALPVASIRPRAEPIVAPAPVAAPVATAIAPIAPTPAAPAPRPQATPSSRGVSRAAVLIERTAPRLSARARRSGVSEGSVSIEFTVDRTGAVTNPKVIQADPPGILDDAALRAVREWRYQPALANGAAAESRQRVTIRFTE